MIGKKLNFINSKILPLVENNQLQVKEIFDQKNDKLLKEFCKYFNFNYKNIISGNAFEKRNEMLKIENELEKILKNNVIGVWQEKATEEVKINNIELGNKVKKTKQEIQKMNVNDNTIFENSLQAFEEKVQFTKNFIQDYLDSLKGTSEKFFSCVIANKIRLLTQQYLEILEENQFSLDEKEVKTEDLLNMTFEQKGIRKELSRIKSEIKTLEDFYKALSKIEKAPLYTFIAISEFQFNAQKSLQGLIVNVRDFEDSALNTKPKDKAISSNELANTLLATAKHLENPKMQEVLKNLNLLED